MEVEKKKEGNLVLEIDHDTLEIKVLRLPKPITKLQTYLEDKELAERATHVESFKVASHAEDWDDVELSLHEKGFEVLEWIIGDKKDLLLAKTST
ncbi:MAG: hypothetical protein LZ170_04815 [Thaumarchaeota archaeon]|jgi:hypothetical protein|nr:hypothetical protein [Candidatus Terraquivivens yellowstonensis]MCL7392953.1 hypothetical protein [Candidatus Terraquivivens yellowstonensis]MCL7395610.1 hypothetical protein [Candidatus Terraquivivens yellowstonensis]MCL7398565.1 hypothetical protein [Candidatus Terraquivivens yellowstonensis]MCL7399532.1 hypothetical protein [Candidatus Terraquivivens yellowstonensis]